jgi:flagellar protein FlaG
MSMTAIDRIITGTEEMVLPFAPSTNAKSPSPNMEDAVINHSPPQGDSPEKVTGNVPKPIDQRLLEKLVEELSQQLKVRNTSISFSIDDKTKSLVVKVIDSDSEKVIRQIPAEEALALRRRIQELLGALVDKEA